MEEFSMPGRRCWVCGRLISIIGYANGHARWRHRADEVAREEGPVCVELVSSVVETQPEYDRWVCTSCGAERLYARRGTKRGGPWRRALDRRYGWDWCRKPACNVSRQKVWNTLVVDKWRDQALFRHELAPNPEQPEQDDPSLAPFLKAA